MANSWAIYLPPEPYSLDIVITIWLLLSEILLFSTLFSKVLSVFVSFDFDNLFKAFISNPIKTTHIIVPRISATGPEYNNPSIPNA